MLMGAVADDLTGATDLALTHAREGMRIVQVIGVPPTDFEFGDAEAEQIVFKYCSTRRWRLPVRHSRPTAGRSIAAICLSATC